jgi:CO/xanthine dehydrogenase Mo-binding subunit
VAELSLTRRRFLKATGWTAAGVTILYLGGRRLLSVLPSFDAPAEDAGAAWLQILPDGRCRMLSPRAEMGQNASLGLAQLAAEELNLAVEAIDVQQPSTDALPQVMLTAGSRSLKLFGEPMARAAAALRETLRARAAERAGVPLARRATPSSPPARRWCSTRASCRRPRSTASTRSARRGRSAAGPRRTRSRRS